MANSPRGGLRNAALIGVVVIIATFVLARSANRSVVPTSPSAGVADGAHPPTTPLSDAGGTTSVYSAQVDALRTRLAQAPADTTLLIRLGNMLADAHQPADAVMYYRRYLELRPANRQVWLDLANSLAATGSWQEALAASLDAQSRYPDDPSIQYNVGAVYANLAQRDEATTWWRRVATQRRDPELARMASESLKKLGAEDS